MRTCRGDMQFLTPLQFCNGACRISLYVSSYTPVPHADVIKTGRRYQAKSAPYLTTAVASPRHNLACASTSWASDTSTFDEEDDASSPDTNGIRKCFRGRDRAFDDVSTYFNTTA